MNSKILDNEKITLNSSQTKLIISGWGKGAYDNSEVERITYLSDGLKIKGYMAYPKNSERKNFPCIIWNRGGYKNRGAIDQFTARGIFGQMASWGYVVLASQYRGSPGSEGEEGIGGNDLNDILNLISITKEISFADENNIGIEGWSRGGLMTFLTLIKNNNFKCAVLSGAISNIKEYAENNADIKNLYEDLFGVEKYDEEINKRTIINQMDKLPDIPYLLMHGGKDETIPVAQTLEVAENFTKTGKTYKLVIFENGDHFLKNHRNESDSLRKEWFDKYLKNEND
jgi:dipeptidyl aminopeptidase/acylaminoacyl peptidase